MTLKHSSKAKWAKKQHSRQHRDPGVSGERGSRVSRVSGRGSRTSGRGRGSRMSGHGRGNRMSGRGSRIVGVGEGVG